MHQFHLIPEFLFPLRRALARGGVAIDVADLEAVAADRSNDSSGRARHVLLRSANGRLSGGRLALSESFSALVDQDAPLVSTDLFRYLHPKPGYSLVRVMVDATPWRVLAALSQDVDMSRALESGDVYQFAGHFLQVPRSVARMAMYSVLFGTKPERVAEEVTATGADAQAENVLREVRDLFAASFCYIDGLNGYQRNLGRTTVQQLANRNAHHMLAATHAALSGSGELDAAAVLLTGPDAVLYQVATDQLDAADAAVTAVTAGRDGIPALAGAATAMLLPNG